MRTIPLFLVALGLALALSAQAGLENVSYPVAELGGCAEQNACRDYCSEPLNFDACMAYAQANDLLEEEEIQEYKQMQELVAQGGPGDCTSEAQCEAYCSDLNHMRECLAFAQEHGMMDEQELEDAQKVQIALDAGYTMPGGCTSEDTCKTYCEQPGNMEECLTFASVAGFMSEEEISEARQVMTIMENGDSPGGCQSQGECEAYCEDEANRDECMAFAVEAGFMSEEEVQQMLEMQEAGEMGVGGMMEEFVGPGGCTDDESCRAYCELEGNKEECGAFFGDMEGEMREDMSKPNEMMGQEFDEAFYEGYEGEFDDEKFKYEESDPQNRYQPDDYEDGSWQDYPEEYQLEGTEGYELLDEYAPDWQEIDENEVFDSFDPGDDFEGFNDDPSMDDIYIELDEESLMPIYNEDPSADDTHDDSPGDEQSLAPSLDAGFVESVKRFLFGLIERVN